MKRKFPQIVAVITLVLILVSVVLTFVGAFMEGPVGEGLLFTGIFGFVFFAIGGWILIRVFRWVHREDIPEEEPEE